MEALNSSWAPNIPKSASVWTVIEAFKREETLARATNQEAILNVHVAHNAGRTKALEAKMSKLKCLCENFSHMKPIEYLETVDKLMFK